MNPEFPKNATLLPVADQVSCELGADTVILQWRTGSYYGLNDVGTLIWEMIQKGTTLEQICTRLLQEFEVDAELCERDVVSLVEDLSQAGLIQIADLHPSKG